MSSGAEPRLAGLLLAARAGDGPALGQLLEGYRSYLTLLVRVQIGRGLQSKVDAADLVQDTFLEAYHTFARFRGSSEGEWVSWLRQLLASHLAMAVRHYYGTKRRDLRLERRLAVELDRTRDSVEKLWARALPRLRRLLGGTL